MNMNENQVFIDKQKMDEIIMFSYNIIKNAEQSQQRQSKSQTVSDIIALMKKELEKDVD